MEEFIEMICNKENIELFSLEGFERLGKGFAMRDDNIKSIGYSPKLEGWEKIHLIAHELGHHVLGHLDSSVHAFDNMSNSNSPQRERNEREAQVFAVVFTAMAMFSKYSEIL